MEKFGADFLKNKYDLHNAEEVKSAAERTEIQTQEKVPQNTTDQIGNYLDRFNEILDREDPEKRERGVRALKELLHRKFVIKPEEVPESAFLLEQRIARELGHGTVEITEEFREKKTQQIIEDQTGSMDRWINYLSSTDAMYPDWAKYWAFRSMLEMGKLQKKEDDGKEKMNFQKRTSDTIASFAPLNERALALTIGVLESYLKGNEKSKNENPIVENKSIKLSDTEFQKLLSTENFSKIYTQFLSEIPEYSAEGLQEIRGEWVVYPKGSDANPLVKSLEGHPLEWCTANLSTAQSQLEKNDFHVYYSLNQDGEPIIPRVAIRMVGEEIAEVRGIAPNQNVDPYISPVVQEKMREFPDGALYEKKAQDMKMLTLIENKTKKGQELSKTDLAFLYEMDAFIEGFGYERDPRVEELRVNRDLQKDMLVFFECTAEEIAHTVSEISQNTKAYVGKLEPGIFQKLPDNLEYIYTVFPDKKIFREYVEISGKTGAQFITELEQAKIKVNANNYMFKSSEFTSGYHGVVTLVRLSVADLGFSIKTTTDQMYQRVADLGLELCPPDVGPEYCLEYQNLMRVQDMYKQIHIGMKRIFTSRDHNSGIFYIQDFGHFNYGLLLASDTSDNWSPDQEFIFCLRKVEV
ncbi:MAG: hypothetical protein NTV02_03550 [Candidatus Zambryskibacteria bacterium]|nr:hypothetical protein [Candidatus Zambryskibacteria bacterium]